MFALIQNVLQVFPESIRLNGNIYTDLWTQSPDQLEAIGIYKMPEQPVYDTNTEKIEVDLETKSWKIVPLTQEEIKNKINEEYIKFYNKLNGQYKHYICLYNSINSNVQLKLQLQSYLIGLADYCLKVLNQEIPLDCFHDYPEVMLEDFSNKIK